jgi:hypothetical protein
MVHPSKSEQTTGFLGRGHNVRWGGDRKRVSRLWLVISLFLAGVHGMKIRRSTIFYEVDANDILRTTVGRPGSLDFQARNFTKNGLFSVKSAYHLAVQWKRESNDTIESSRTTEEYKGWLASWAAQVLGKSKVHMWCLIENELAVGSKLRHRKIKDDVVCLTCGETESLVHRFWTCRQPVQAWSLLSDHTWITWTVPPKILVCHAELKGWLVD